MSISEAAALRRRISGAVHKCIRWVASCYRRQFFVCRCMMLQMKQLRFPYYVDQLTPPDPYR